MSIVVGGPRQAYTSLKGFVLGNMCPQKPGDTESLKEKIVVKGESLQEAEEEVKNDISRSGKCINQRDQSVDTTVEALESAGIDKYDTKLTQAKRDDARRVLDGRVRDQRKKMYVS